MALMPFLRKHWHLVLESLHCRVGIPKERYFTELPLNQPLIYRLECFVTVNVARQQREMKAMHCRGFLRRIPLHAMQSVASVLSP
jgi:hypothetical protein